MIPDLNFITSTFHQYNSQIFGSKLPLPRFKLTRARTFRGKLVYRIKRKFLKTVNEDFEIRISLNFDLPQEEWEDVVIHEMIHLYIASSGIKDTSSHGSEFRKLMHGINHNHSRNISISAKSTIKERVTKGIGVKAKGHFVCLARFSDGRLGVAPVAKSRILILWSLFQNFGGVESLKWIGSTNSWFNELPHVRKPKFYLFNPNDILPHLKGGKMIEREGNRIKVINRHYSPDELLP